MKDDILSRFYRVRGERNGATVYGMDEGWSENPNDEHEFVRLSSARECARQIQEAGGTAGVVRCTIRRRPTTEPGSRPGEGGP